MRYSLPQAATRAKKFQSLDGDTRKIAEELVRKKFKIQEEVVPDWRDYLHNPAVSCNDIRSDGVVVLGVPAVRR